MKFVFLFMFGLAADSTARPNFDLKNMVTVPPNCPVGQVWVNGQCRDIWRIVDQLENTYTGPTNGVREQNEQSELDEKIQNVNAVTPKNLITVPPNCPVGQQWVNGACRDIWRKDDSMMPVNVVTVPPNCPDGQEYFNGECRDIWTRSLVLLEKITSYLEDFHRQKRQSEIGDKIDENPESLDLSKGIINVPNQCPTGQRPDALGICRPILD